MGLRDYRRKRDFEVTAEPRGRRAPAGTARRFVVQRHDARRLHYDFRLELDGVLKSWAVPKGPSLDPAQKRLAVEVEDHPLDYADFEGRIPKGEYGAGTVERWDTGTWTAVAPDRGRSGVHAMLEKGDLKFELHGGRLRGQWKLIRMRDRQEGKHEWLLMKVRDEFARTEQSDAEEIEVIAPAKVARGGARGGAARSHGHRPGARGKGRALSSASRTPQRPALKAGESHAKRLPAWRPPQLATLATTAPEGDEWLHEIKFDGYRMSARLANGKARMLTRSGKDWTERFAAIAEAIERLTPRSLVLDGEVVVVDEDGVSRFQALQNALDRGRDGTLLYYVFDLLYLDGQDLTPEPLEVRKRELAAILAKLSKRGPVLYSDHVVGHGPEFHAEACRRELEGVVSKRRDRPYSSTRTRDWIKVKCAARQELVIGGFTEPKGAREGFGALLLGVPTGNGKLRYAGRVGTGFDAKLLKSLHARLEKLRVSEPPFENPPPSRAVEWVKPELVAEVSFTEWTNEGLLRHPSFQGLREDKPAKEVVVERPLASKRASSGDGRANGATRGERRARAKSPRHAARGAGAPRAAAKSGETEIAGVRLTHPERVVYRDEKLTKLDLARYLERVADLMLPHVSDRPLMLLRCPDGVGAPCFFQKHSNAATPAAVHRIEIPEVSGDPIYLAVDDAAGLVSLIQSGAVEIHTWGARTRTLEKPDLMVFDLDPGPDVEWKRVLETAKRLKLALEEWELPSFVKTTGGKGLHVVVPLEPRHSWDDVKGTAATIARTLVQETPDQLTGMITKSRRQGKIYIDTLRNGRGSTFIAPFSPRARPGAHVSMPLPWSALTARLDPARYSVAALLSGRLAADPWAGMEAHRSRLPAALLRARGA